MKMSLLNVFLIVLQTVLLFIWKCDAVCYSDPRCNASTVDIIKLYNYSVEEHSVTTEDGYILGLQRIPHGLSGNRTRNEKPAVLLLHGLLSSSTYYVINGPQNSLGFILADGGFDVWLGNIRGNIYSRRHKKYSSNSEEFWNYNFDDIALKDLPSCVDYILGMKKTHKKIYYVGYSMGTSILLAALSKLPQYNEKIARAYLLAPGVFTDGIPSPNVVFLNLLQMVIFNTFKPTQAIFPTSESYSHAKATGFCAMLPTATICPIVDLSLSKSKYVNQSLVPIYWSKYPAGTSSYVLRQILQIKKEGKFQMDSSRTKDQSESQEYNISSISSSLVLFSSKADEFGSQAQVQYLKKQLSDGTLAKNIVFDDLIHGDFVYAKQAKDMVYKKIVDDIKLQCQY